MTKVKICGITNLEDALLSAKFGADALGFNFYEKSPRYIKAEKVREIVGQLPKEILKVGVFVNEDLEKIAEIAKTAKLDAIQLHGEETPEFAKKLKEKTNLEIIKAFRVSPEFKSEDVLQYKVDAILLDAYSPKEHGGTGETFDWEIAKKVQEIFPKIYLAGGLKLENVGFPVDRIRPFYIDVCSGVEKEKGKKTKTKLINFLKVSKFEQKPINNIYDFCWNFHPNLIGVRLNFDKLSKLKIYLDGFIGGLVYKSNNIFDDVEYNNFFSMFTINRIDKVSGIVIDSVPENHLSFQDFVLRKHEGSDFYSWDEIIIRNNQADDIEALYKFYALLEEYRIIYDNKTNE